MTLDEKMSQLRYDAPAIPRLGIPAYNWWNEALHGVARAGTATVFPQAIGLAAMFDEDTMFTVADAIATEGRAKYNAASARGDRGIYKGLTFWSPNVNIFRDPRWGRGHETYGEDPFLSARTGVAFVKGLQRPEAGPYLKAAACAKHFAVHSGPEVLRHEFDAIVTDKDLWETYLPAFEALVEAGVEAVMGAYNRVNGELCCGSKTLLTDLLRGTLGFEGHVVSDCGAICDFHEYHKVTFSQPESAALALTSGCDLNCGHSYEKLRLAFEQGLVDEESITRAAVRVMTTRFRLGLFDTDCVYDDIPYDMVACPAHMQLARTTAEKSMVLLKNDGLLPLDAARIKTMAVIGPTADSRVVLQGNYCGTMSRPVTFWEGLRQAMPDTRMYYAEGCPLFKEATAYEDDKMTEAVTVAGLADVTVLCLGLDSTLEGEQGDAHNADAAGDKENLLLPATQRKLLSAVLALGKPVVLLLSSGSAIDVGEAEAHPDCHAILQTWYPGEQGGAAAARLLTGQVSPSGKLPVTFYHATDALPDFCDYSMKHRTYRYMASEALYPFGFGLSYANVEYEALTAPESVSDGDALSVQVCVKNRSGFPCEEVVQTYVKIHDSAQAVRNHSLCAFARCQLAPGEEKHLTLNMAPRSLMVVNDAGERVFDGGGYTLYVGGSQPDTVSVRRSGQRPLEVYVRRNTPRCGG